eukprot:13993288-Ditylum_brightwellii.AAC.1
MEMVTIEASKYNEPSTGKQKKERKQLLLKGICCAASVMDSLSQMNSCSHLDKPDNNGSQITQGAYANSLPVTSIVRDITETGRLSHAAPSKTEQYTCLKKVTNRVMKIKNWKCIWHTTATW